jgi:uncharacterized surface protein with fasciclin (FAS1) repeats
MESAVITSKDIVDTIASCDNFGTFTAALKTAEMFDVLKRRGPYTVFVPTDEAFADLPLGTLDYLLKPANRGILARILGYHMVHGKITAEDIAGLDEIKTVNGEMLRITSKYGKVMVDCATVIMMDLECANGIIHVIDLVAVPKRWV